MCRVQPRPLRGIKQPLLLSCCSWYRTSQHALMPGSSRLGLHYTLSAEKTCLIPLVKIRCPFAYFYTFKITFLSFHLFFLEFIISVHLPDQGFSKYLMNDLSLFRLLMLPKPEVWGFSSMSLLPPHSLYQIVPQDLPIPLPKHLSTHRPAPSPLPVGPRLVHVDFCNSLTCVSLPYLAAFSSPK